MVRGAWCMVHGAWCVVHGAWCVVHACAVRGAWCVVRGAWCVVRGAWCVVCVVRGKQARSTAASVIRAYTHLDGVCHGVGRVTALGVLYEQLGELDLQIEPELHRGAQRLDLGQLGEGHAEDAGLG